MTEIEALAKIAMALDKLASAAVWLAWAAWLTLLLKSQTSDRAINNLAEVIKNWRPRP